MGWNGLDLINDFSAELGDVSNGFKTKVLRFINEGIRDIATAHEWSFCREKGKVLLTSGLDTHALPLAQPIAPVITLLTGGSLTLGATFKVLVTFYEAQAQVESKAGLESNILTTVGADLSITVSDIPISTSPLVTERRIYVSKNGGSFQLYGTITNNLVELPGPIAITLVLAADPTSVITPPEENAIRVIDGDVFIEGDRVLVGTSIQNLIFSSNGVSTSGTPQYFAPINQEEILVHPTPNANLIASFYYFKIPNRVFGINTSVPQIPSWLYEDLRRYVIWRGYEFRDRAGKESKQQNYDQGLRLTISRRGKPIKKSGRVRCVTPDSDGNGY